MDGDEPERLDNRLIDAGFYLRQSLVQMMCDPSRGWMPAGSDRVVEARGYEARFDLCRFAARTFFTRTPDHAQERIAEATARSNHRLLGMWDVEGPLAMMMLCESESAVGIYNLCVRRNQRRRGLGKLLVDHAVGWGQVKRKPVVLQCSLDLVDWYRSQSFQNFGTVHAYTFASAKWRDII